LPDAPTAAEFRQQDRVPFGGPVTVGKKSAAPRYLGSVWGA